MRKLLVIFTLLFASFCLVAQSTENFNKALDTHDVELAKSELSKADKAKAVEMEKQMIGEVKKAVAEDDLDYAYSLTQAVLDVDFDNMEAQKLFNSISKAKKAKQETLERQAAEEKKRQEEAEQKKAIEEYKQAKIEEAQKKDEYIEQVSSITFKNFPLDIGFTPVAINLSGSPFADEYNGSSGSNIRYGVGGFVKIGFVHPYFLATAKADYTYYLTALSGSGKKGEAYMRTAFGIPYFSKWFRICFTYDTYKIKDDDNSSLFTKVDSPKVGFGLEEMELADGFKINIYGDLDLNTFDKSSEIQFAYSGELDMKYTISSLKIGNSGRLFVEGDFSFYSIRINHESEWNQNSSISLGVSFND